MKRTVREFLGHVSGCKNETDPNSLFIRSVFGFSPTPPGPRLKEGVSFIATFFEKSPSLKVSARRNASRGARGVFLSLWLGES